MNSYQHSCSRSILALLSMALLALSVIPGLPLVVSRAASPALARPLAQAINPNPPASPVKLIFIHHSCGENWLQDVGTGECSGGLGVALRDNTYYVSDTNYGWGPEDADLGYENIGDHTDIGHWYNWFVGPHRDTYLSVLYTEYDKYPEYSYLDPDPGGQNEIIMFKSCFPNSNLEGNPDDPPAIGANPLRGQDSGSEYHTVANAKGVYNDLLTYFATRQDRLFIVITAPPVTDDTYAANARAFNTWLVNDWLAGYAHSNVAVFDFYNVLTHPNNHHRVYSGSIQYVTSNGDGTLYYPGPDGSHPSAAGNQKARDEFVPLLNVYYNRWKSGITPSLTLTAPTGGTTWPINRQRQICWTTIGAVSQVNLDYSTDGFATSHDIATSVANTGCYTWTTPATPTTSMQVRVADAANPATVYATSAAFTLYDPSTLDQFVYLPLVARSFTSEPQSTTDPVLFFSDLVSGPRAGNGDASGGRSGQDGAIVTLWGRNLGSTQGSSKVYANGVEAASYYSWGNATAPADLYTYHRMQRISFQLSRLAQNGLGSIYVVVNGRQSNALPFTVRAGNIYFAATAGDDDTGDGSWGNPWRTIPHAADSLAPGDIAYIGDGVDQTTETNYGAAVNLGSDGAEGNPKALVVYPGATSRVGHATIERAFWVWNVDSGGYAVHWVIAGFTVTTGQVGVPAQTGFRAVGNYVTAPQGDGMDGAIDALGNGLYILGNELEQVGSATCSKLYHAIYLKGVRQDDPPRAPTESNREVAWNYIHDGLSNRAINIYSEQDYSAYIQQHHIHDNVIVNQRGDGILLGYYVTGDNWIYNNLVVNAGLGPEWVDDPSYHTGIRIDTGYEEVAQTRVYLYNNTLYGNGWSGATYQGETGSLLIDPGALARSTTVYLSNNIIYSTGEPYLADESTTLPAGDYRNCWYGDGSAPAWDTTAINDDPDFVNAAVLNFQLQNGSPCVDTGKNVSPVVARDILGMPRPQGPAFDLGAYETIPVTLSQTVYLTPGGPLTTTEKEVPR